MEKNTEEGLLLQEKKKIDSPRWSFLTIYIFVLMILSVACYSVISPFMPVQIAQKGVDSILMGYIMGIFAFGLIFVSPIMPWVIQRAGRRWPIGVGCLGLGISFQLFALISYLDHKMLFIVMSFALRFLQGVSTTLIHISFLSIVSTFYPSNKEWMIGMIEAVAGAGMMLGPLIGTGLYAIAGYQFMLISFGGVFIVLTAMIPFTFPKFLDLYTSQELRVESTTVENQEVEIEVSKCSLLTNPGFIFPALSGCLGYMQFDYLAPILGLQLLSMGLTVEQEGLFFCISPFFYIFGAVGVANLPKTIDRKACIIFGLFTSTIFQFMIGPSQILGLPQDSIWMIAIGYGGMGITNAFILVYILPEMITVVESKYPSMPDKQKAKMADYASGVMNSILGIGQIMGPIYGSTFVSFYGWNLCTDGMALLLLVFGVIYLLLADGITAFRKSKLF